MTRGKNYVNNNKGVVLQASAKSKAPMRMCEYGPGCSRPDCIYRHDEGAKSEEFCLPFLAGKCTFTEQGCKKRHPKKEDSDRLIAKYKRTRCRFGDECYTECCLYLHPREVEETEPNFVEPHHVAFPPLNGASTAAAPKPVANSAWKAAPAVAPSVVKAEAPAWFPTPYQAQMCAPYDAPPVGMNPVAQSDMGYYEGHDGTPPKDATAISFNANAKEFVPGSFA